MKNVLRRVAGLTAVLVVVGSGTAVAQDGATIEGLVWFDRNGNGRVDEGEPPLANGRGVRVFQGKQFIGEYGTDANGRYRATGLPASGLTIFSHNTDVYAATTESALYDKGAGAYDFGVRGGTVTGLAYVDANRDGVKQDGERPLQAPHRLGDRTATTTDGGYRVEDVPEGEHAFQAADLRRLSLVDSPELDWSTGAGKVFVGKGGEVRLDTRYFEPRGDFAVGPLVVTPAKDVYALNDEVEVVVTLTNKGDAPDSTSFVMASLAARLVSASDQVTITYPELGGEFELKQRLAPGASVDVRLRYALDQADIESFHVIVRLGAFGDVNFADNVSVRPISVRVPSSTAPSTTTTAAPTSTTGPSTTAAPTTSTTPAAVAGGGRNSTGLARTGAAPLPFLVIGGLLLGGGVLTYLAARRRRA
ncbi:hypothetical protein JOF41_005964 [Saccharothrix coeruleofusca]|uniref:hypothetical protein n=1 Tax=Saccharothrix coeruleofusca TaxID=33919 RepID=UPI001AEB0DF0|nr:hypothetical protein [Saccharothrix coeruleofusca]MBP2339786.1 hypothetical protein [Saccharothrix coeruleofusca]